MAPQGLLCSLTLVLVDRSSLVFATKPQLDNPTFVAEQVKDTDEKNLILSDGIKPTTLSASLSATLLRA